MKLVWGVVVSTADSAENEQLIRCFVDLGAGGAPEPALCYPSLTGDIGIGDTVLLNTTAVDLSLGTGGSHFVVARLSELQALPAPGDVAHDLPSGGHVMKLRYTPLQHDVLAVEAQESPFHGTMARVDSLDQIPVVCCGLHSQVPLVAAAIKQAARHLNVAYVMTDQAALPLALSGVVAAAKAKGLIDSTVTCGQAFGGDYEAVNLHSGLLAACHIAAADVIIVAIGPGVVGTSTPFGHGGVIQGEAINAVSVLGGLPVACLRMSFADERERHRGISHHTRTALERVALRKALVAVPLLEDPEQSAALDRALESMGNPCGHEAMQLEYPAYREQSLRGIRVTTMGRSYSDDPAFFEAAFAAGVVAALVATQDEGTGGCG